MLVKTPWLWRILYPSIIWKKKNKNNYIWLTFDDGPCPKATPIILKILQNENIKATFFLIGEKIHENPKLYSEIISQGHFVANHSFSHKNGWLTSSKNYIDDVEKCQELMPTNYLFRPPYGKISVAQIKLLKKKYKIILWDVFAWDFLNKISSKKIKKNIIKNTTSGSIIVLHNNEKSIKKTHKILTEIIQELKKKKFTFSTTW